MSANKQPFYVSAGLLFTMTDAGLTTSELEELLAPVLNRLPSYVPGTFQVEYVESTAGDPADLL